jgi:hypothetical protein
MLIEMEMDLTDMEGLLYSISVVLKCHGEIIWENLKRLLASWWQEQS